MLSRNSAFPFGQSESDVEVLKMIMLIAVFTGITAGRAFVFGVAPQQYQAALGSSRAIRRETSVHQA